MLVADRQRRAAPPLEKRLVHIHPFRRKDAHVDFRFRIVEADTQKALAMVLDLYQRPISGRLGEPDDRAVINPWMARQDAVGFARFEQDSRQGLHGAKL